MSALGAMFLFGLTLSACGASNHAPSVATASSAAGPAPPATVVVQVGATPITGAIYDHWMSIGAATVEIPKLGGPLPKPVAYEPPGFAACVARLRTSSPMSTTVELTARCKQTYTGIQARILNFLITGYWLRGEAADEDISISEADVRRQFEQEKRRTYPTAASFQRFMEASGQTVPDLMFAVRTAMLSSKLLSAFTKASSRDKPEGAKIMVFNQSIESKWAPRTDCQPGYVVKDCKQFKR